MKPFRAKTDKEPFARTSTGKPKTKNLTDHNTRADDELKMDSGTEEEDAIDLYNRKCAAAITEKLQK